MFEAGKKGGLLVFKLVRGVPDPLRKRIEIPCVSVRECVFDQPRAEKFRETLQKLFDGRAPEAGVLDMAGRKIFWHASDFSSVVILELDFGQEFDVMFLEMESAADMARILGDVVASAKAHMGGLLVRGRRDHDNVEKKRAFSAARGQGPGRPLTQHANFQKNRGDHTGLPELQAI